MNDMEVEMSASIQVAEYAAQDGRYEESRANAAIAQAYALRSIAELLANIEEHLSAVAFWVNNTGTGNR